MSIQVEVRYNDEDNEIYCTYDKTRIEIGEKFAYLLVELYSGEVEKLPHHLSNLPAREDYEEFDEDNQPFISPT